MVTADPGMPVPTPPVPTPPVPTPPVPTPPVPTPPIPRERDPGWRPADSPPPASEATLLVWPAPVDAPSVEPALVEPAVVGPAIAEPVVGPALVGAMAVASAPTSPSLSYAPSPAHDPWPSPPPASAASPARVAAPHPALAPDPGRSSALRGQANPANLEARELSAWFGKRKVLERCNLRMEAQRVTALIGPSGCGKSTFLRMLNRMHEVIPGAALAGNVLLDDIDIYGGQMSVTAVRTRIGMVFQKPNPFPAMTIGQNVLAGLKLSGTSAPDKGLLVEECLTRAGLWTEVKDRLNEGGMTLSGGQQQRLCIARALAVRPQVLLMDEPCSALDPISTRVVEETIRELGGDITIVIVTHNMQQAVRVSQQCAFFLVEEAGRPGRIIESGETTVLFESPADSRTLDYVTGRFG